MLRTTLAPSEPIGTRQDASVIRLTTVRMIGPSMEPAVRHGDWWIVHLSSVVRPGDVIMIRHPLRRHLIIVKRAEHRTPGGWWVTGDNPEQSEDSRSFGAVPEDLIEGRLVVRYRPLVRW